MTYDQAKEAYQAAYKELLRMQQAGYAQELTVNRLRELMNKLKKGKE